MRATPENAGGAATSLPRPSRRLGLSSHRGLSPFPQLSARAESPAWPSREPSAEARHLLARRSCRASWRRYPDGATAWKPPSRCGAGRSCRRCATRAARLSCHGSRWATPHRHRQRQHRRRRLEVELAQRPDKVGAHLTTIRPQMLRIHEGAKGADPRVRNASARRAGTAATRPFRLGSPLVRSSSEGAAAGSRPSSGGMTVDDGAVHVAGSDAAAQRVSP